MERGDKRGALSPPLSCKRRTRHLPLRRKGGVTRRGLPSYPNHIKHLELVKSFVSSDIPLPFPFAYLILVHAEMMRKLVPDSLGDDIADVHLVFFSSLFDRNLIERYSIRHRDADAVILSALGKRNAVIVAQKGFVFR